MIYQIINGELKPSVSRDGRKFKSRRRKRRRERNANKSRDPKIYAFYQSSKWQRKSRQIREREPLCRACVKEYHEHKRPLQKIHLATSCDHIIPLKFDFSKRLDDSNLQPLCHYHHKLKDKRGL